MRCVAKQTTKLVSTNKRNPFFRQSFSVDCNFRVDNRAESRTQEESPTHRHTTGDIAPAVEHKACLCLWLLDTALRFQIQCLWGYNFVENFNLCVNKSGKILNSNMIGRQTSHFHPTSDQRGEAIDWSHRFRTTRPNWSFGCTHCRPNPDMYGTWRAFEGLRRK